MPRLGDFAVWMRSNGEMMEEHAVSREGNVMTAFIASEAGQRFAIVWDLEGCDGCARAVVHMDGSFVRQRLHHYRSNRREYKIDGVQVDSLSFRPFVFQEITFTDEEIDNLALHGRVLANEIDYLGTVIVEIDLVKLSERETRGSDGRGRGRRPPDTLTRPVVLPENTKRVGSLRMGISTDLLERPMFPSSRGTRLVVTNTIGNGPVAVFKLICRPREFLVAEGFIPRTISETPNETASPSRRLFLEEMDTNSLGTVPTPRATPSKGDIKNEIALRELVELRSKLRKREAEVQKKILKLTGNSSQSEIKLEDGSSWETAWIVDGDDDDVIDLTSD